MHGIFSRNCGKNNHRNASPRCVYSSCSRFPAVSGKIKKILNFFLLLVIAHLLGDFPLQTNWVYRQKFRNMQGGLWHAGILLLCYLAVLSPYLVNWQVMLAIICLTVIHYLQDFLKVKFVDKCKTIKKIHGFWLDQAAHLILIIGISFWLDSLKISGWQMEESILQFAAIYLIVVLSSTFMWNVICHSQRDDKILRRDWQGIFIRGGIVTLIFGVIWLVAVGHFV